MVSASETILDLDLLESFSGKSLSTIQEGLKLSGINVEKKDIETSMRHYGLPYERMQQKKLSGIYDQSPKIITIDDLTKAIRNSVTPDGDNGNSQSVINREEAKSMAEHVTNFFGYSDRIIDNILKPEDRDIFYQLEDVNLLITEREETTLYDGRELNPTITKTKLAQK